MSSKSALGHRVQKINSAFPLLGQAREENIWKKDRKFFSVPHPSLHESTEVVVEIEFQSPPFWFPKKDALSIQMQKINSALPPLSKQERKTSRNRAENLFLRYPFLARVNGRGPGNRKPARSLAYPPLLRRRPRCNAGIMRSNGMQVSGVLE